MREEFWLHVLRSDNWSEVQQPGGAFRWVALEELRRTDGWEALYDECARAGVVEDSFPSLESFFVLIRFALDQSDPEAAFNQVLARGDWSADQLDPLGERGRELEEHFRGARSHDDQWEVLYGDVWPSGSSPAGATCPSGVLPTKRG
jgi:hypothetical protein